MYYFNCDYNEGCHERILKRLIETNNEQTCGYGFDKYSLEAKEFIKKKIKNDDASIYFLIGGTQTNLVAISYFLRPAEGVIACDTGHINTHETGAIELTGHKVLTVPGYDGKMKASDVDRLCANHYNDPANCHLAKPKMIYISHPTEYGTLYTKEELISLYEVAKKYNLYFFVDGARLGYALSTPENEITYEDLGKYTSGFYIGGTKCGTLFGEALVLNQHSDDIIYQIKARGALLAKGRINGIQWHELFKDGLYDHICDKSIIQMRKIVDACKEANIEIITPCESNQLFIKLSKEKYNELIENFFFTVWEDLGDKIIIRICTSYCTKDEAVDCLINNLKK